MATNVLLPQWGMNMEDGLLVKWLVSEGDTVEAGQPLVEIETAKIESELESPVPGVIAHIMASEGEIVDVGNIVAVIAEPGETVPRPTATAPTQRTAVATPVATGTVAPSDGGRPQVTPVARRLARENDVDLGQVRGTGPSGRVTETDVRAVVTARQTSVAEPAQVVPRARQLARQRGVDLAGVQGTGPNCRILVEDVERAATGPSAEVSRLVGTRKRIAARMMQSVQSMAQVTLTTEVDVTDAVALREELVSRWRSRRIRPMDLDLVVMATAEALKQHPRLNATLSGEELRILKEIHVGVAMAVEDGLMVPVVKGAGERDLLGISTEIRALADRTRKGQLSVDDVSGATFTVTSLAGYGVDAFTPIIDPPQVAILGVGRVVEKAAVHQGDVAARSMMALSLTFDHRALDGVPAGEFLQSLSDKLQDPSWMAS